MPVAGDVIQVKLVGSFGSEGGSFTTDHHYRVTAIESNASLQTWLDAVGADYEGVLKPATNPLIAAYPTTTTFTRLLAFNINTPTENATYEIDEQGTAVADQYNVRAAMLIGLLTGQRGRSYRGRLFYPSPAENNVGGGGEINSVLRTTLATFASEIKVLGTGDNNGSLTVYSKKLSTESIVFNTLVTGFNNPNFLASQRRRRRNLRAA